jgi:hypothetical protein
MCTESSRFLDFGRYAKKICSSALDFGVFFHLRSTALTNYEQKDDLKPCSLTLWPLFSVQMDESARGADVVFTLR